MAAKPNPKALMPVIFPSHVQCIVRAMSFVGLYAYGDKALFVGDKRPDAAGEAENARPAFALDLFGAEAKRGNAAIHRQAVACWRAIEGCCDAKNLPPP